jgi:hypothetical protein
MVYLSHGSSLPSSYRSAVHQCRDSGAADLPAAVVTVSCDRAGEGYSKQSYSRNLLGAAEAEGEQRQSLGRAASANRREPGRLCAAPANLETARADDTQACRTGRLQIRKYDCFRDKQTLNAPPMSFSNGCRSQTIAMPTCLRGITV